MDTTSSERADVDVVVLGSGVNELVCAAYLAKSGQKVIVLERLGAVGGIAAPTAIAEGFSAAVAPAAAGFLSPRVVEDLRLREHGFVPNVEPFDFVALGGDGGPPLVLSTDTARTRTSIATRSKIDAEQWDRFAAQMARLAGFLESLYEAPAIELLGGAPADALRLAGHGLRLRRMGKVDMVEVLRVLPMSVWDLLDDWFEDDRLKGALASTALTNLLQGPRSQGTGFSLLHHHVGRGGFGPRPSGRGIIKSLTALLKTFGVEVRTGVAAKVLVDHGQVRGVSLEGGGTIGARAVVSGADPKRAFFEDLDPAALPPEFVERVRHVKLRGARAVLLLALDAAPTFGGVDLTQSSSIVVAPSLEKLERAYDAAKHGGMSPEPMLEISLGDGAAPQGKQVLHVAAQFAPYRLRAEGAGGWDDVQRARFERIVFDRLAAISPDLEAKVAGKKLLLPPDLERDFGLTEGHLYGGELTLDQILFMRPVPGWAHYKTPIRGYLLCGDATHPGGGLPGLAGRHASTQVLASVRS